MSKQKHWRIITKIRSGIKDVEGATAERRFRDAGFEIENLNVGQVFFITGTKKSVEAIAKKYLVNTQLYDYDIEEC